MTRLQRWAGVGAVLLLCAPFTYGAIGAFPIWDDGWIWLLLREEGAAAIAPSFADRPVNAAIWSWLARHDALFPAAFVAQATFWPLLGALAALLWTRLYPSQRRYAPLVALLTVAPFVTKVQMVTVNVALASLLPVLLAYGAVLLLWRFITYRSWWALLVAVPALATGILIQEYGLAVALIGLTLLGSESLATTDRGRRRRTAGAAIVVVVTSLGAYGAFLQSADYGVRQDTSPAHALQAEESSRRLPQNLGIAAWRVVGGGAVRTAVERFHATRPLLPSLLLGMIVAGLLVCSTSGRTGGPEPDGTTDRVWWRDAGLLITLVVGIAPILVMGRIPWDPADGMSSRYGIPVLPVAAAVAARLIGLVERWHLAWLVIGALGLTAGTTAVVEAHTAVQQRRAMTRLAATVRPHVERIEQFTVAVVPLSRRPLGPVRPWELVARLSFDWPVDLGRRLWAYRYGRGPGLDYRDEAREVVGPRHDCRFPRRLNVEVRRLERRGRVHTLAWLAPDPDGSVTLEPYCR